MLDGGFVDAALQHFGTGRELACIGRDASSEIAAMCILQPRTLGRWQSFLPSQAQIGPSLLRTAADVRGLLQALPGFALQADLLSNDPKLGDLCAPGVERQAYALTTSIRLVGGFDAYWSSRPSKLRQNMRRYARKLREFGPLRMLEYAAPQEVKTAVRRYSSIEVAGWKGLEGTALRPGSDQESFYSQVMVDQAGRGGARAYELWAGSQLVAARLAVIQAGMVVMLKTTYDERFAAGAPGHVLLQLTIERLFETDSGKSIEFYTNATHEQLTWSTDQRRIDHATFYRWPIVRTLGRSVSALRGHRA
jgi:hypothetical protein